MHALSTSCLCLHAEETVSGLQLTSCPKRMQANLLASGGGTADRCIKFWNTHTGALLNSIDTSSQACARPCCALRRCTCYTHVRFSTAASYQCDDGISARA